MLSSTNGGSSSKNHKYLFYTSIPITTYLSSALFATALEYEYLTIFLGSTTWKQPYIFILGSGIILQQVNLQNISLLAL